jgi:hypothetical protein
MSFTVTVYKVADKDLGSMLAVLKIPRGAHYELTHFLDVEIPADIAPKRRKKRGGTRRSKADLLVTKLTMSGKLAKQPESAVAKGLAHFENCEVELGIGNVTVEDFRSYLKSHRMQTPENLQKRMIRDHYLDYLE